MALSNVTDAEVTGNADSSFKLDFKSITIITYVMGYLASHLGPVVATNAICLLLIALKLPPSLIMAVTGFCARTVRNREKAVAQGNWQKLETAKGRGRKGKLGRYKQEIIDEIISNNYQTLKQIAYMIEQKYKIIVSNTTVGKFLKENGIRRLKSGSLPAKADPVAQRKFYEGTFMPLAEKAVAGLINLFSMDAVHCVMGGNSGYVYGMSRRMFKTASGRQRYNILGAINLRTKKMTTVTNYTYINAESVCDLLHKIANENKGIENYITLDNAKYQKCKLVQKTAEALGIHLVYLPTYSPNLNIIERYWKYLKSKLRVEYFDNFYFIAKKWIQSLNVKILWNKKL
jgi:transposase